MSPPYEDPETGWQAPHQGLIQGEYTLHLPLSPGDCLSNGREVPIHLHPTREAEVEEEQCREIPCWCGRGRRRHFRTDPIRHHTLQIRCEGMESGVRQG